MALSIALLVAGLWGLQPIIQKELVKDLGPDLPLVAGSALYFLSVLIFAVVRWPHMRKRIHNVQLHHLGLVTVTTVLCAFLANLLFLRLLVHNDSFWVTAIAYSSPVVTALLAVWLLRERLDAVSVTGVLLVTVGVIMLSSRK